MINTYSVGRNPIKKFNPTETKNTRRCFLYFSENTNMENLCFILSNCVDFVLSTWNSTKNLHKPMQIATFNLKICWSLF